MGNFNKLHRYPYRAIRRLFNLCPAFADKRHASITEFMQLLQGQSLARDDGFRCLLPLAIDKFIFNRGYTYLLGLAELELPRNSARQALVQCCPLPSSILPTGLPRTTMSFDRTHPYGLVPPSLCSRLVQSWLEEDCSSFDYAGYVVGDFPAEASIIGRSPVRVHPISFKMKKIINLMIHQIAIRYGLGYSDVYSCHREYLLDYRLSMRFSAN